MTHKQLLDKFAAKHLAYSIEEDISRLVFNAMNGMEHGWVEDPLTYILSRLLLRWNSLLKDHHTSKKDKHVTELALAVLLHKYGFADHAITDSAINAFDQLNETAVLPEELRRKSNSIKNFLLSKPIPLKKLPVIPDSLTFYRAGDAISIQLEDKFYAAYVHEVKPGNECPVIEFYDSVFKRRPDFKDIEKLQAKGEKQHDGIHMSRFAVYGMRHLPDPANQIHLIKTCVNKKPSDVHLKEPTGLYSAEDIFSLQLHLKLFAEK